MLSIIIGAYLCYILFITLSIDNILNIKNNNNNYWNSSLINELYLLIGYFSVNFDFIRSIWLKITGIYDNNILIVSSNMWDGNITTDSSNITNIGNILYTNNNIWLILTSLILLLAMVGSIVVVTKSGGSVAYALINHGSGFSNKRFFSSSSTSSQLVINSDPNNIVFNKDDQSILMLPSLSNAIKFYKDIDVKEDGWYINEDISKIDLFKNLTKVF